MIEAEKLFSSALTEAKKGFGERDPHVASACNNLVSFPLLLKMHCTNVLGKVYASIWRTVITLIAFFF